MRKMSTLALIALMAFMATSCDLVFLDLFKSDQDSSGQDSSKQGSGPSALGVAERQAEYTTLFKEFDDRWLLERRGPFKDPQGMRIPEACGETVTQARDRDDVLANALILAAIEDKGFKELYDLWGKRIELLKELNRKVKQDCR